GSEKRRNEFRSSVGGNMIRNTVFREDMNNEKLRQLFGGDFVVTGNKDSFCLFGSTVNYDQDSGVAVGVRKLFDEIH
ncbi:hypothetical protein C8R42DRAFT_572506, partial [Lentinula raphanica]